MKEKIAGHFFALVTITIWSSTFIISKIVLETFKPTQVLFMRFIIASIVLTIIYPKFTKLKNMKHESLIMVAALCLVGYFVSENTALTLTRATNVSLIVTTIPIISLIIANAFGKEKQWNKNIIIGFIIAYIGVVIVVFNSNSIGDTKLIGDIIALVAALFFAVYSFVLSQTSGDNIIRVTRNVFYYMTIVMIAYNLANGTLTAKHFRLTGLLEGQMILSLLFLGVVASSFAFIMWNQAIKWIGGIRTNQYIYFSPVITTIMAAVWLKESITIGTVIGATLIIGGVYLSEMKVENGARI